MTTRTRYFVIAFASGAGRRRRAPGWWRITSASRAPSRRTGTARTSSSTCRRDAAVIAYADVRGNHDLGAPPEDSHARCRCPRTGSASSRNETGINIETDIDRVVACLAAGRMSVTARRAGLVLARGRFDEVKIEALMREHGAQVEDYNGKRLIENARREPRHAAADPCRSTFSSPGSSAVGSGRAGARRHRSPEERRERHDERRADEPHAVARPRERVGVGRLDALAQTGGYRCQRPWRARFRPSPGSRSAATSTAASAARSAPRRATTRRPTTCATSCAASWRSRKLQAGSKPELQTMVQSLELGGTGKTVALSFSVPGASSTLVGRQSGKALTKPPSAPA